MPSSPTRRPTPTKKSSIAWLASPLTVSSGRVTGWISSATRTSNGFAEADSPRLHAGATGTRHSLI